MKLLKGALVLYSMEQHRVFFTNCNAKQFKIKYGIDCIPCKISISNKAYSMIKQNSNSREDKSKLRILGKK